MNAHQLEASAPMPLSVPAYRRLWFTGLLYYRAYWLEIIGTGWYVLQATGSAFAVGLVGFCRMLPMLVLSIVFETIADRIPRATILLTTQVVGLLSAGLLASLAWSGRLELWSICILTGVLGCIWASDFPTRRALIAETVPTEVVRNAMSLEAMSMQGSKIVATLSVGALLALGGAPLTYTVLCLVYLASGATIWRARRLAPRSTHAPQRGVSLAVMLRSGVAIAWRSPVIRVAILITVVMNLLVFPYQQLIVVVAQQILSVGPQQMGLLAGADGFGAILVSGFLAFRAHRSRAGLYFALGAMLGAAMVMLLGVSKDFALSVLLQILAGAAFGAFATMQPALFVESVAPELRARALGLLAVAIGGTPFGILLVGALSAQLGASVAVSATALAGIAIMLAIHLRNRALLIS